MYASLLLPASPLSSSSCCSGLSDNLLGRDLQSRLCLPPVDIVYTWVNGSDPLLQRGRLRAEHSQQPSTAWSTPPSSLLITHCCCAAGVAELELYSRQWKAAQAAELAALAPAGVAETLQAAAQQLNASAAAAVNLTDQFTANRFRDNDELRFSLRSVWRFAPWARHVFIVTNGQVPHWLNLQHPRLTLVSHAELYPNRSHLPTFSSPSIECHLHRIPGLSSHYVYLNDDVLLGNEVWPDDFFTSSGGQRVFLSWNVPNCAPGCPDTWRGDAYCDQACNNALCDWDGGDCQNVTAAENRTTAWVLGRQNVSAAAARYCSTGCSNAWVGDKVCDRSCKVKECAFDGGDCGLELIQQQLPELRLPAAASSASAAPSAAAFSLEADTTSLFVNLSAVLPGSVTEASHDNSALVRSAIVTQSLHILTLILYREEDIAPDEPKPPHRPQPEPESQSQWPSQEPADVLLPPRVVEIFLAGEVDGAPVNVTFTISRPRVAPDREQRGERGAAEQQPASDDSSSITAASPPVGAPRSASELPLSSVRRLQSVETPTSPVSAIRSLFMSRRETRNGDVLPSSSDAAADASPLSRLLSFPAPGSSRSPPSLPASLAFSLAAAERAWSSYDEVVVEGVPLTRWRHGGVKLRGGGRGGDERRQTVVRTERGGFEVLQDGEAERSRASTAYLVASGAVVEMWGGWTEDDEETADRIQAVKRKELWLRDQQLVRQAVQAAVSESRPGATIWPWELGVGDSQWWGQAWTDIDALLDGRREREDRDDGGEDGPGRSSAAAEAEELSSAAEDGDASPRARHRFHSARLLHAGDEAEAEWLQPYDRRSSVPHSSVPLFVAADPNLVNGSLGSSRLSPLINPNGRHLMDTYGESLRHVNRLFTAQYGREMRKAPAHMPHAIQRAVMEELQGRWPQLYDATSQHRFRHPRDMQMAFAYFYFLMNEPADFDLGRLWREQLDWDGDGRLSEREVQLMAVFIAGKRCRDRDVDELRRLLLNVSASIDGGRHAAGLIDLPVLEATPDLVSALESRVRQRRKYRTELATLDEVEFFMLPDNATLVRERLDGLRVRMPKFLCLNDDMNKTHQQSESSAASQQALREFYLDYFPQPSPFENPPDRPNRFLSLADWRRHTEEERATRRLLSVAVAAVAAVLLGLLCTRCRLLPFRRKVGAAADSRSRGAAGGGRGGPTAAAAAAPRHPIRTSTIV